MPHAPQDTPWYDIPASNTGSICRVYVMQAGGLDILIDDALLPGPNIPASNIDFDSKEREKKVFFAPDYVFLIEHLATGDKYFFDLGMRKDLENSPPSVIKGMLSKYNTFPESPVDILKKHGTPEQQPSTVKAVIFSHLHFDHIGDAGKAGFTKADLWLGPSTCTVARPGYPVDNESPVFSTDLAKHSNRKIVEFRLPSSLLDDKRKTAFENALLRGYYDGIDLYGPPGGWFGLGAFERCFDLFDDGSAYLIDAPGHMAGHQMLLVRVNIGSGGMADDFVLLAGDCFHHAAMLADPLLTARPPFYKSSMHGDPETAIDTMYRTKRCAEEENIWVVGAHDFSVGEALCQNTNPLKWLVPSYGLAQERLEASVNIYLHIRVLDVLFMDRNVNQELWPCEGGRKAVLLGSPCSLVRPRQSCPLQLLYLEPNYSVRWLFRRLES
jgi:glyoxylase-like metal-dependent hydrolase (beta-lactamase superfamily II)